MTSYSEIPIGEILEPKSGKALFTRDFMDANPGEYPVYSASVGLPFGFVDRYDYEGSYLSWVMNGYGGRVRELEGKFSLSRDRGVFLPKEGVQTPDLTFLRFAIEPGLVAAAVGRKVDGRRNEYTKIYPADAGKVTVRIPLKPNGDWDYSAMSRIGERLRGIENAQQDLRKAQEPLDRAKFVFTVEDPVLEVSLGDSDFFCLEIGERVLRSELLEEGVPAYSANALSPFGHVAKSNLNDFDSHSILWGIDGNFDFNLIEPGEEFATTDHCGRLRIVDEAVLPAYVFAYLKTIKERFGFDRVFRASLRNMKDVVAVKIPVDGDGRPDIGRQEKLALAFERRESIKAQALAALEDVLKARVSVEAL